MKISIVSMAALILQACNRSTHAFTTTPSLNSLSSRYQSAAHLAASTKTSSDESTPPSSTDDASRLSSDISKLKKVLAREYATFFSPMETQYYAADVTFTDPMTSLSGVQSYQNNVDMLASRTMLGKFLFDDAGIVLHGVEGGEVSEDGEIGDIITRWTLRLTAKVLPWSPTARFSGISVYRVEPDQVPSSPTGVKIVHQKDYWDSINIAPSPSSGGRTPSSTDYVAQYHSVPKSVAVSDFIDQLKPGGFQAQAAAPELPYQLLRRGDGYEVRSYPGYTGVKLPYRRRDEGFGSLGAFTKGMRPLSPALMEVQTDDISDKYMMWPLTFVQPGQSVAVPPEDAIEKAGEGQWRTIRVVDVPSKVVAVREFSDASMEPVVRKADRELRELLERDGLVPEEGSGEMVMFAQYDAIFSMGRRRGEVWIDLMDGGHPWN